MMKKFFKLLSAFLALVLSVGLFAACGNNTEIKTGGKYTYWVTLPAATSQTLTSFNELLFFKEMAKATGTEVEFIHPAAGSTGSEAFQILLTSGDYPDMIEYNWKSYTGGPDQAINDGVIISLNDYLKDYAPNYYDYMEGHKGKENGYLYKVQGVSANGNYYGFNNLSIGTYRTFGGIMIRKDMLDKWGLDIPETIDEWEVVLKTAKENGFRAPLTGAESLFSVVSVAETFNVAWDVAKDWYVEDGTVKFGPFEKGYKDYVKKMREWMEEGYIDPDYVTNSSTDVEGYLTNDISIAAYGFVGGGIGKLMPAMEERNPEYSIVACPYPVLKKGDRAHLQDMGNEAGDPSVTISVSCGKENEDRYKEAIKWCDYLYSDDGMILKTFGIEGETYTIQDDKEGNQHYVYTDKIYNHEELGAHSVQAALFHYIRPGNGPGLNQHPDYLDGYYPYKQQKEAIVKWNENVVEAREHILPPLSYTAEEAGRKASLEAVCASELDGAISNIILGKASFDTYDDVIKKAKKNGYGELLKIQQTAYDRYIKATK